MQLLSAKSMMRYGPAEIDRRLGALLGQRIEPFAGAAGEHDDQAVVEQRRHVGRQLLRRHDARRRAVAADDAAGGRQNMS